MDLGGIRRLYLPSAQGQGFRWDERLRRVYRPRPPPAAGIVSRVSAGADLVAATQCYRVRKYDMPSMRLFKELVEDLIPARRKTRSGSDKTLPI